MEEHAQGARPKTYSLRKGNRQDYERMHEGDAKLKKQLADVRDMPAKTPGQSIVVLEGSESDVGSSKKQGTSLPKTNEQIEALDKEILELQASISKTQSSLKEVSIKKQCRERSNRVAKLRKELFVAEQQLQKAEEEETSAIRVAILSDFIAKYVDNIRHCEVIAFSSININALTHKIQTRNLILDREFTILHVGTNNIETKNAGEILSCYNNLISVIRQINNTKIIISAILPRPIDHSSLGDRVKLVNTKLKPLCRERNVQFLHTFRPFLKNCQPIRELYAVNDQGLHLNLEGVRRLRQFFINSVAHLIKK